LSRVHQKSLLKVAEFQFGSLRLQIDFSGASQPHGSTLIRATNADRLPSARTPVPRRLASPSGRRLYRPVQPPQRLPLDAALHYGVGRIVPDLRQGSRLLRLADGDPRLLIGVDSLGEGGIIKLPPLLLNRFQRPVLLGRRAQLYL
jgi:hypothetical protein